jgi:cold shock CspA family protein
MPPVGLFSMQGIVKFFRAQEGYFGFIATEAGDFFFHGSSVIGDASALKFGVPIEFDLGEDRKGRAVAVNVRRLGAE